MPTSNITETKHPHVLLVEDEESFIKALTVGLQHEGMQVSVARDGKQALDVFDRDRHDIVLLDVMLPKLSGIDVCREMRRNCDVPILMVTAKNEEVDAVVGLEIGADDYIAKPYRLKELVARIRAHLRRRELEGRGAGGGPGVGGGPGTVGSTGVGGSPGTGDGTSTFGGAKPRARPIIQGDLVLDPVRHEVNLRGEPISLPLKEFDLLWTLMLHGGQLLTRQRLINEVWGDDYVGDTKTLDVHIKRLRTKIEDNPSKPARIVTIRGLGYKFQQHS